MKEVTVVGLGIMGTALVATLLKKGFEVTVWNRTPEDVFAASVPGDNFDDPQASVDTYVAAFKDTLDSFRDYDVNHDFPRLMSKLVSLAAEAGLGDKQITSLVRLLSDEDRPARTAGASIETKPPVYIRNLLLQPGAARS